jgi:hypothetical protein
MSGELLPLIYKSIAEDETVYVVVEEGDLPFVDSPRDDKGAASVNVFTTEEGAAHYMAFMVEARDFRPSQLKVLKTTLTELWEHREELSVFAFEEYGAILSFQLMHSNASEGLKETDLIYTQDPDAYN